MLTVTPNAIGKMIGYSLLLASGCNAVAQVLFFDDFEQFGNGTDLTSTNYVPASGPASASVVTSVQNGSPTITATNSFFASTWAWFDNSVVTNKNQYKGILSSIQTNQPLQITWKMWIKATNSGSGAFLFSVPVQDANPSITYNPPLGFLDTGAIIAVTNGTSPITIGSWIWQTEKVITNTLILNYPSHILSYALDGQTLATLPLGPYFTNVVNAIYFNGSERSSGSLGNRFVIDDVLVTVFTPQLAIADAGVNVVLTWPTNAIGFTLQSTTNLAPPVIWGTNLPVPVVVNGRETVTNPIAGTQQFFRLKQ